MEDLVKTYFHDKVFFSAEQMQVELKLENWKERLVCENLADEQSKVEGKVEFTMYITVENDA